MRRKASRSSAAAREAEKQDILLDISILEQMDAPSSLNAKQNDSFLPPSQQQKIRRIGEASRELNSEVDLNCVVFDHGMLQNVGNGGSQACLPTPDESLEYLSQALGEGQYQSKVDQSSAPYSNRQTTESGIWDQVLELPSVYESVPVPVPRTQKNDPNQNLNNFFKRLSSTDHNPDLKPEAQFTQVHTRLAVSTVEVPVAPVSNNSMTPKPLPKWVQNLRGSPKQTGSPAKANSPTKPSPSHASGGSIHSSVSTSKQAPKQHTVYPSLQLDSARQITPSIQENLRELVKLQLPPKPEPKSSSQLYTPVSLTMVSGIHQIVSSQSKSRSVSKNNQKAQGRTGSPQNEVLQSAVSVSKFEESHVNPNRRAQAAQQREHHLDRASSKASINPASSREKSNKMSRIRDKTNESQVRQFTMH